MEPFFQMGFFWKLTGYKSILKRFFSRVKDLKWFLILDVWQNLFVNFLRPLFYLLVFFWCLLCTGFNLWQNPFAAMSGSEQKVVNSCSPMTVRVIASLCPCFYERIRSNNRVVPTSVARVLASQCCFSSPCTLKVAEVAPESLILLAHSKGSLWMLLRSSTLTFHHLSLSVCFNYYCFLTPKRTDLLLATARLPGQLCPLSSNWHVVVSQKARWCTNHPLIPQRHQSYVSNVNFLQEAFQAFLSQKSSYCRSNNTLISLKRMFTQDSGLKFYLKL